MVNYSEVSNATFIQHFDSNKHKVSDYKLIILLNGTLINGENHDGECLFIPYLKEELEDGRIKSYFEHRMYLAYALRNYDLGVMQEELDELINKILKGENISADRIVGILGRYGIATFYDASLFEDKYTMFNSPLKLSSRQTETLGKIAESLIKEDYVVDVDFVDNSGVFLQNYIESVNIKDIANLESINKIH